MEREKGGGTRGFEVDVDAEAVAASQAWGRGRRGRRGRAREVREEAEDEADGWGPVSVRGERGGPGALLCALVG